MTDGSNLAGSVATDDAPRLRRRLVARLALGGAGLAALALGTGWGLRDRLAAGLIDRELAALGLPAHYRIESIGLGREVIGAVVIGDPAHPDLTVERVEVALRYGLSGPQVARIALVRPRLAGRWNGSRVSFGALDKVLYAPSSGAPLRLPDWDLALVDGRARVDSPWGQVGLSADGAGRLSDGFAGTLGAVTPEWRAGDCRLGRSSLYLTIHTRGGKPSLAGPARVGGGACGARRFAAGRFDLGAGGDLALTDWSLGGRLSLDRVAAGDGLELDRLTGDAGLHWRAPSGAFAKGELGGHVTLAATGFASSAVRVDRLTLDGLVHARQGFSAFDFRGDVAARSPVRGPAARAAFDRAARAAAGSPVAPLLAAADGALRREEPGSRIDGTVTLRSDASGWRLVAPNLDWRGGTRRQTLASLTRVSVVGGDGRIPRVTGNFATGGAGLPQITGTMSNADAGGARFHLAMAPYAAGGAQLAIPGMAIAQVGDGSLGFSGTVALTGPLGAGGGRVEGLVLPVEGGIAGDGRLALWRRCADVRFASLRLGQVDLDKGGLRLCPGDGAIVKGGAQGMVVAASVPGLALAGHQGDQPIALSLAHASLAWPGTSRIDSLSASLGRGEAMHKIAAQSLTLAAEPGGFGGAFTGTDAQLAAVPLSASGASGAWHWGGGGLTVTGASLTMADRVRPARFAPLPVREATLTLAGNAIDAQARVIAPVTGGDVARVTVHHDLNSGNGRADFTVPGLVFADTDGKGPAGLQPADLSDLAKGVIANAAGTITGTGHMAWTGGALTSGGTFHTDGLDFAAAFGPVKGLSGTMVFTDLANLVTAPHQVLKVASVNPGIEVTNGTVDVELLAGQVVRLNGAQWPFEGGMLRLEPTELHMAVAEPRRFTLAIEGLDAGRFLQHMNMSNLAATGTFDGRLPLVFDANGGRITGGTLVSRAPGGSVSYVGALTYKDLSAMANYAFSALRAMDYQRMTLGMEGDLAGEVVTRVSFSGVRQGAGTSRNFITRQLANLPIRFDVNIRAQFYTLINSLRSLYDPTMVRDPRSLGLVDNQGRAIQRVAADGTILPTSQPAIQSPASGTMP